MPHNTNYTVSSASTITGAQSPRRLLTVRSMHFDPPPHTTNLQNGRLNRKQKASDLKTSAETAPSASASDASSGEASDADSSLFTVSLNDFPVPASSSTNRTKGTTPQTSPENYHDEDYTFRAPGASASPTPMGKAKATDLPLLLMPTPYDPTPKVGSDIKPRAVDKQVDDALDEFLMAPKTLTINRKDSQTLPVSETHDIYFSPVEASASCVFLSSPLPSPPLLEESIPESASETEFVLPKRVVPQRRVVKPQKQKITLTPAQVDELVAALVNAPLIQKRVRGQYWDAAELPTEASSFRDPDVPSQISGVSLLDPSIIGLPASYISPTCEQGTNVLMKGQPSQLTAPYGASSSAQLYIEPASGEPDDQHNRVVLRIMQSALRITSSRREYLLAAEVDVTASFLRAALTEFASSSGVELDDVLIALPLQESPSRPSIPKLSTDDSEVDWLAFADEVQEADHLTTLISNAKASLKALDPETCTMQVFTLLSALEHVKTRHSQFLIVQPTRIDPETGKPRGVKIPWSSQQLLSALEAPQTGNEAEVRAANEYASEFRARVVGSIMPTIVGRGMEDEFETELTWGRMQTCVRAVPVTGGTSRRETLWVAFLGQPTDFL